MLGVNPSCSISSSSTSRILYTIKMKRLLIFIILFHLNGVFGESVSVLEGNPVCLHTYVTDIEKVYLMWSYRSSIIAKLDGATQEVSLYDVDEGIFEDRLQLDNQTGSLTINDIRTKHSGLYQLKIISNQTLINTFNLTVQHVFLADLENKREGDSVTLNTGVTEMKKHNLMVWMFGPLNPDVLLAEIRINTYNITYGFDEKYTDRVHLNHESGSLTIRDLKPTDTGVYQLQISNNKETIYKRFNVFVADVEPGLLMWHKVAIGFTVVLIVAGALGGIYFCQKYSKLKDEMNTVSEKEGNSVKLTTGISKIKTNQKIVWKYGAEVIAEFQKTKDSSRPSYSDDKKFKNKLQLNPETGNLKINDIKITISGDYHLDITNRTKITRSKRFKVVVQEPEARKPTEGETVKLETGISHLRSDEKIQWRFKPKGSRQLKTYFCSKQDTIIAEFYNNDKQLLERFKKDSLISCLNIANIRSSDAGEYELQIKTKTTTLYKTFHIIIVLNTLEHTVGDSVILKTDIGQLQADDQVLWTFGKKDTTIAEINRVCDREYEYDGNDERFRDRVKLNKQNGDLTITNISRGHSEVYKLQITRGSVKTYKKIMLKVHGDAEKLESVNEGGSVTLQPDDADATTQRDHVMMLWMFGPDDNLIAKVDQSQGIPYAGADGRFKEKLVLKKPSGSLTITNINTKHAGLYKLQIISNTHTKYKRFRVSVPGAQDHMKEQSERDPLIKETTIDDL